jgi:hypothetical protein
MLLNAPTSLAVSRGGSLFGKLQSGVFGGVLMPSFAMGSGLLPLSVGFAAQRQPRKIAHQDLRQHFLGRQSGVIPPEKRIDVYAQAFRPLHSGQRQSFMRDSDVSVPVIGLLFAGRPTAIFWAVWAIIINAIKRVSGRPFAQIVHKIFKVVPPFANVNSTLSIAVKCRVARVVAPLFNCLPQNVNGRLCFAVCSFHTTSVI